MKKKIVIFISEIKYSGAAKIATWLANKFAEDNIEVYFVTYLDSKYSDKLSDKVKYICINCNDSNRYVRSLKVISRLNKLLRNIHPSLAISFLPSESLFMLIARCCLKIPIIVAERSDPYLEKSVVATVGRFAFRFADGAVFQTHGAMNYFPTKVRNRGTVIANPALSVKIDFVPYKHRRNAISHVARLDLRQKRQDLLIDAFKIVLQQVPEVKLEIYGDGASEREIKEKVNLLQMNDSIVFKGRVNNVTEYISGTKISVLSSDFEGIPNSIIESLAAGVPVVSTDCSPGGARELIKDGYNGYVVPRNAPDLLAERILFMLNNPDKAEQLAHNGLSISEQLDEKAIYEKWKDYCFDIMKK